MDYKTANGAITRIDESIDYLSQLKKKLTADLLSTDLNSLSKIRSSVNEIEKKLKSTRASIETSASEMSAIENKVKGGE